MEVESMKKSLSKLKTLLMKQIESENEFLTNEGTLQQKNNPQVKTMIDRSEARKEALEDVLFYINTGSTSQLKIGG
jgi:hypothetical protein